MLEKFSPVFFRQLQQLKIRTRRTVLGSRQGAHLSSRKGYGLEFADFRQYSPGDDFRHIDWGVLARTDRFYIRQFREEQDLNVVILIDASRSMQYPKDEHKFEQAKSLGLALGYVALSNGDRVTYSMLGGPGSPTYSNPKSIYSASKFLAGMAVVDKIDLLGEIRSGLEGQKLPGKCFFISDFLYPFVSQAEALNYLTSRNFDVSVIQVLAPSELNLPSTKGEQVDYIDSETGEMISLVLDKASQKEYKRLLFSHVEKLQNFCHKNRISYLQLSSEDNIEAVVLKNLEKLGLLM